MPPENPTASNTTDQNFNRNKDRAMHVVMLTIIIILGVALGLVSWQNYQLAKDVKINSFTECVAAGYPVMESYPEKCMTKYGGSFTNETQVAQPGRGTGQPDGLLGTPIPVPTTDPTAGWKVFENETYGYTFKHAIDLEAIYQTADNSFVTIKPEISNNSVVTITSTSNNENYSIEEWFDSNYSKIPKSEKVVINTIEWTKFEPETGSPFTSVNYRTIHNGARYEYSISNLNEEWLKIGLDILPTFNFTN